MSSFATFQPSTPSSFRAVDPRQAGYFLRIVAVGLLAASFFAQDPIAYLCVTIPVLIPAFVWVKSGAFGIPVLPVISALFYLYYAMPLLVGYMLTTYRPEELVWAALSVGLFLTAASVAARPFLGVARNQAKPVGGSPASGYAKSFRTKILSANFASNNELYRLILIGFLGGILYYSAVLSGSAGFFGTFLGVVRAVLLPLTSIACYLIGFARGEGSLTGQRWFLALGGFLAVTLLSMSGLFLVGSVINIAAAMLGYVLASKRIPWLGIGFAVAIVSVLNAGKYSMRAEYWTPGGQSVQNASILTLPTMMASWFEAGVGAIESTAQRDPTLTPTLLERISLLHMVLIVQEATPRIIPYLDGETYALLPSMLVPRFLQADKTDSQAALNLLSVRYGQERAEDTNKTTIGWGLVAEAYANFGNPGVVAVGAVFGALCGMLMRLSATAAPVSLAMLITIASTLTLFNLESDFSYLIVTLFQTIVGVLLFAMLPRFFGRRPAPVMRYVPRNLE